MANTATKEHGIDVIAARDGQTVGVEVKGFPSRGYADPARAGEVKRTSPSTQAGHWYSQAVLAAMRLRGKEPEWRSVIALPDFPRYRELSRRDCRITRRGTDRCLVGRPRRGGAPAVTRGRWYARPEGDGLVLRKVAAAGQLEQGHRPRPGPAAASTWRTPLSCWHPPW